MKSVVVLLVALAVAVLGQDKDFDVEGLSTKVLGRSGQIKLIRKDGNGTREGITIRFESMTEKSMDGAEVGKKGRRKHTFNSFATRDFQFSPLSDGEYQGVSVKTLNFTASNLIMDTEAKLTVELMIFKEDGNFTVGNTHFMVKKGTSKFNIGLDNWVFCGDAEDSCQVGQSPEMGDFVEFTMSVKGSGVAKMAASNSTMDSNIVKYWLGAGQYLSMVKEISVDGVIKPMKDGYPKMDIVGAKQSFTFALPKGKSLLYDPLAEEGVEDEDSDGTDGGNGTDGGSGGDGDTSSASTMILSALLQMFTVMFALWF